MRPGCCSSFPGSSIWTPSGETPSPRSKRATISAPSGEDIHLPVSHASLNTATRLTVRRCSPRRPMRLPFIPRSFPCCPKIPARRNRPLRSENSGQATRTGFLRRIRPRPRRRTEQKHRKGFRGPPSPRFKDRLVELQAALSAGPARNSPGTLTGAPSSSTPKRAGILVRGDRGAGNRPCRPDRIRAFSASPTSGTVFRSTAGSTRATEGVPGAKHRGRRAAGPGCLFFPFGRAANREFPD